MELCVPEGMGPLLDEFGEPQIDPVTGHLALEALDSHPPVLADGSLEATREGWKAAPTKQVGVASAGFSGRVVWRRRARGGRRRRRSR